MTNDNKVCIICGTHYRYCEGCPTKYNTKETWRNLFCSERCRSTYHIYDWVKAGRMSDKEASKELRKVDASYLESLNEPMKSVLVGVMNTDKKVVEKPIVEEVKEEVKKKVKEEKVEVKVQSQSPTPSKRGRRKKN